MKIGMESFQECRLFAPNNKGPKRLKSLNEYYFLIGKYVGSCSCKSAFKFVLRNMSRYLVKSRSHVAKIYICCKQACNHWV